jgi:hypothetical protein
MALAYTWRSADRAANEKPRLVETAGVLLLHLREFILPNPAIPETACADDIKATPPSAMMLRESQNRLVFRFLRFYMRADICQLHNLRFLEANLGFSELSFDEISEEHSSAKELPEQSQIAGKVEVRHDVRIER